MSHRREERKKLVRFRSKAAGDLLMFEENAREILNLLGKDVDQGIITAEQTAKAITTLQIAIDESKEEEAREKAKQAQEEREQEERELEEAERRKWEQPDEEEDDPFGRKAERQRQQAEAAHERPVPFSARAFPFIEMLRAAHRKDKDIIWGV